MGYTKINQFANVTEIYSYDNEIKPRKPNLLKAYKLANNIKCSTSLKSFDVVKNRKKLQRVQSKTKGLYKRADSSIKRSKQNFFRLCHHNNYSANSIHFLTLTFAYEVPYKTASRHVARFMEKIQINSPLIPVSYISVPELTKKNRFHFHLLVYDLPAKLSGETVRVGNAVYTTERTTRNLQGLFERGYVDIVPATYTSKGIAGYMAKYMGKSLSDTRYENVRGYNASRNIKKIRSTGGNTVSKYFDLIIPTDNLVSTEETSYNVPYLGLCQYKKITSIKN